MSKKIIEMAQELLKTLQSDPTASDNLQKSLITASKQLPGETSPAPKVDALGLAKSLLEEAKQNPEIIKQLEQPVTEPIKKSNKELIKEELAKPWEPRYHKVSKCGEMKKPAVEKCGEVSKTLAAKACPMSKEELKAELKQEWKPRFYKADFTPTLGDQNPTAMKAQRDPTTKPVMGKEIIKPKDVKEVALATMGIPKSAVFTPKPKGPASN